MEHYRRLGIAGHVRTLGMPADHPTDVIYFTRFGGWELARLPMPSAAETQQRDRRRAQDRSSARTAASRQPDVCREIPARTCAHAAEHRGAVRLASGRLRRRWRRRHSQRRMRARRQARDLAQRLSRRLRRRARHSAARARHSLFRRAALQQAYMGGRMFSTHVRVPTLARDFLRKDVGFQYWVINPELRTTITSVNGTDEFMFWTRAEGRERRRRRPRGRRRHAAQHELRYRGRGAGASSLDRRHGAGGGALRRGPRLPRRRLRCICSRRPAASA